MIGLARSPFANLVETPKKGGAVRRSYSGRLLTDLTRDGVMERMSSTDLALFLGTMSGGGEAHTVSLWWVPGFGRRDLIVKVGDLADALERAVALEPEPEAVPAQASLFG